MKRINKNQAKYRLIYAKNDSLQAGLGIGILIALVILY